jgi:hypothetical protein
MAKFKCIHSGTIVEFFTEYDDRQMRQHHEYVEVVEEEKPVAPKTKTVQKKEE